MKPCDNIREIPVQVITVGIEAPGIGPGVITAVLCAVGVGKRINKNFKIVYQICDPGSGIIACKK
jgi:hypothetical protein